MLFNPGQQEGPDAPRANLVLPAGPRRGAIWMGGAHTARGEPLDTESVRDAIVIDCAGDLSPAIRTAAWRFYSCVFLDVEERPTAWDRIVGLAATVDRELTAEPGPARAIILCTHGMNRSGLVAGLLLRRAGLRAEEALSLIRTARPGALSNQAFVRLLAEA